MKVENSCFYHSELGHCSLGLFGGRPLQGNCRACIANGENTPAYAEQLFARAALAHPPDKMRISGCCDPPSPQTQL